MGKRINLPANPVFEILIQIALNLIIIFDDSGLVYGTDWQFVKK